MSTETPIRELAHCREYDVGALPAHPLIDKVKIGIFNFGKENGEDRACFLIIYFTKEAIDLYKPRRLGAWVTQFMADRSPQFEKHQVKSYEQVIDIQFKTPNLATPETIRSLAKSILESMPSDLNPEESYERPAGEERGAT